VVLLSWIGANDLKACPLHAVHHSEDGPILSTLKQRDFDTVHLLYNYGHNEVTEYLEWLQKQVSVKIIAEEKKLSSPTDYVEIYQAANAKLDQLNGNDLTILISPGTPAMQAVWILLGKTKYPAKFIQSSIQQGVQEVEIPFEIAAEYQPVKTLDNKVQDIIAGYAVPTAEFDSIITNNPQMQQLKQRAAILAQRDVPVVIHGETGTGKELFARAIHNTSTRANKPFVVINCGAIPSELIDSTLFGHIKGAFTGAISESKGLFGDADGGTLFLDEFGELPLSAQVRLLRVLQDGSYQRVGSSKEIKTDVRVISATHRDLVKEIAEGKFREDLYYRVAIGLLHLPPLRSREGDLSYLIEFLLNQINTQFEGQDGYKHKNISASGKNILLNHSWPGNIRELNATLLRASLFSFGDTITDADIIEALTSHPDKEGDILNREINEVFNIQELIDEVEKHYIKKALKKNNGNKKKATDDLGLNNYQTLTTKMKKFGLE